MKRIHRRVCYCPPIIVIVVLTLLMGSVCSLNIAYADGCFSQVNYNRNSVDPQKEGEEQELMIVTIPLLQSKFNSTSIISLSNEQITSIKKRIIAFHREGKKVILIPEVRLVDNQEGLYSNNDIGFSDEKKWKEWIDSYEEQIIFWSKTAERLDVELFCAGSGLSLTLNRSDLWEDLICNIRNNYNGEIAFFAEVDCINQICFWKEVDLIGVNFRTFMSSLDKNINSEFFIDQIKQSFLNFHNLSSAAIVFV